MNKHEPSIEEFFEKAYWMQRGEYFPQIHNQNIDELCQSFPWGRAVIKALYLILPHFDYTAEEAAKTVKQGMKTRDQAYQDLCFPVFQFIPETVKRSAWDLHLSFQDV